MGLSNDSGRYWRRGIILAIACSMVFFAGLAIWASIGDVELVYDNYYAKDVVFEEQIERVARTDALSHKPSFVYNQESQVLTLTFPSEIRHISPVGEVLMFRPADLHKDRLFDIALEGDTLQAFSLPDLAKGLWRIKLSWSSSGVEYYLEQMLMVN